MAGFNLKDYVPVADRLDKFRADHPLWGLSAELLYHDDKRVLVRASITDEAGREVASGHAEEVRNQGNVNKTSAVENAETSAWGRALAALGYDVKGGIASREEMQKASRPPEKTVDLVPHIKATLTDVEATLLKENWKADGYSFTAAAVPEHRAQELTTLIDSFAGLDVS